MEKRKKGFKMKSRLTQRDITAHQRDRMINVMNIAQMLEESIEKNCKDNREKSLAMTKLEECVMWVNKSISHEKG